MKLDVQGVGDIKLSMRRDGDEDREGKNALDPGGFEFIANIGDRGRGELKVGELDHLKDMRALRTELNPNPFGNRLHAGVPLG